MKYKKKDLVNITWYDFDNYILKLENKINFYLKKNNLSIDVVVPILRGGCIPAIKIAFDLNVINILPFQYKYVYGNKNAFAKKMLNSKFSMLNNLKKKSPVILVVEGNHSTGYVANLVVKELKKQKPNSKILYVSLAKDYYFKDSVKNIEFTDCGFYTNENRKLNQEKCKLLNISYEKVYLFPWENIKEELSSLNGISFKYS